MTRELAEKMAEAAAKAAFERVAINQGKREGTWENTTAYSRKHWRIHTRAALLTALRILRELPSVDRVLLGDLITELENPPPKRGDADVSIGAGIEARR